MSDTPATTSDALVPAANPQDELAALHQTELLSALAKDAGADSDIFKQGLAIAKSNSSEAIKVIEVGKLLLSNRGQIKATVADVQSAVKTGHQTSEFWVALAVVGALIGFNGYLTAHGAAGLPWGVDAAASFVAAVYSVCRTAVKVNS